MMKFLGTGIALAVGAGAFYYWWSHDHAEVYDHMERAADHLHDKARQAKDSVEEA